MLLSRKRPDEETSFKFAFWLTCFETCPMPVCELKAPAHWQEQLAVMQAIAQQGDAVSAICARAHADEEDILRQHMHAQAKQ
jgi:hypothetical protein